MYVPWFKMHKIKLKKRTSCIKYKFSREWLTCISKINFLVKSSICQNFWKYITNSKLLGLDIWYGLTILFAIIFIIYIYKSILKLRSSDTKFKN